MGLQVAWTVAPVLRSLRSEIDALFPLRSRSADGLVGDARHKATQSDHNPNERGVVRAWDVTRDNEHGPNLFLLSEYLRQLGLRRSDRLQRGAFIVFGGRICSFRSLWEWKTYSGRNPHWTHMHISAPVDAPFYNISRPWNVTRAQLEKK